MDPAPSSENEQQSLFDQAELQVLNTPSDNSFDQLTQLLSQVCSVKVSCISFTELEKSWVKSCYGVSAADISQDLSIFTKIARKDGLLEISDCRKDKNLESCSFLNLDPPLVFYASCPIKSVNGHHIGTLSIMDDKPRILNDDQKKAFKIIAEQVTHLISSKTNIMVKAEYQKVEQALLQTAGYNHEISSYLTTLMLSLDIHLDDIPQDLYDSIMRNLDKVSDKLKSIKGLVQTIVSPDEQLAEDIKMLNLVQAEGNLVTQDQLSVLLVEDDHEQREFLAEVIEFKSTHNLKVTAVEDGLKAIEETKKTKFDIIVTDFDLPKTDGIGFIKSCRSEGRNLDTPIIFTSGGMSLVDTGQLLDKTPNLAILEKPFKIEQLIELMETSFAGQSALPSQSTDLG